MGDGSVTHLVEGLYARLAYDGELRADRIASALHAIVSELRDWAPELIATWAPFVHFGAGR